jgi:hypothetical protein
MSSLLSNYDYISTRAFVAGQKHNQTLTNNYDAANVTAVTPYGCALALDATNAFTSPNTGLIVKVPSATTDKIVGISFLEYIFEETRNSADVNGYPQNARFPFMTFGDLRVFSETINSYKDPVFVRVVAGTGGTKVGYAFRNVAVSGETIALPNCYWLRTTTATNQISVIHIDI